MNNEELNPYRASAVEEVSDRGVQPETPHATVERRSPLRTAVRWFSICSFSAIPSFVLGYSQASSPASAMITGVILFAIGYTALDYSTAGTRIRQNRTVRRTLKITYGTRILVTIVFPVAFYLDVFCGIFSVGAAKIVFGSQQLALKTFAGALFTTLFQGFVMNGVLLVYAIGVHAIQVLSMFVWRSVLTR